MGLGNGNPKAGDKGSNFDYELKVLKLLEAIAVAVENGSGINCDDLSSCPIIEEITKVTSTIDAQCFIPNITIADPAANLSFATGQYQRVGNIVTCTVFFQVIEALAIDTNITINVPIQDVSSDYSTEVGLIMGSLHALQNPDDWRNLDFSGPTATGISFYVRSTGAPINSKYVAQFSYAYNTNLCTF